jgi:ABC-type Mn2+/Zn2+ transport system ATPase subunit
MTARGADLALEVRNLTVGYGDRAVLKGVSWQVERGTLAAVIGPNGGGKSTLLKTAVGLLRPFSYDTLNLLGKSPREGRRSVAYLPQREEVDWSFPITVLEVVLQGRLVKKGWLGRLGPQDREEARRALELFGLTGLERAQIGALSGGQRQRVFLARAVVQEADLILLDEPAAGLDAQAQHELAGLLVELSRAGKTIIAATHDLDCLTGCFDQVLALNGRVLAAGKPSQVLTEEFVVELFAKHFPKVGAGGEVTVHEP